MLTKIKELVLGLFDRVVLGLTKEQAKENKVIIDQIKKSNEVKKEEAKPVVKVEVKPEPKVVGRKVEFKTVSASSIKQVDMKNYKPSEPIPFDDAVDLALMTLATSSKSSSYTDTSDSFISSSSSKSYDSTPSYTPSHSSSSYSSSSSRLCSSDSYSSYGSSSSSDSSSSYSSSDSSSSSSSCD